MPAVNPLKSFSNSLVPGIVGEEHYHVADEVKRILQQYEDLKEKIAMLGMEELGVEDEITVSRARKVQKFMSQPFFIAAPYYGWEGRYVDVKDTIKGFKEIIDGEMDNLPEEAFSMVGTIEEAIEKAKELESKNILGES